jgi:2-dehydro-3-deoxyphosphogluconate aldolase/(4S)-4-hydroxy-2-oxoglutarate aldolase
MKSAKMNSMQVLKIIEHSAVIPVLTLNESMHALPLAKLLKNCGFNVLEITLRTKAGIESLKLIREHHPDVVLGTGTVLSIEHAEDSIAAGANFLVSPGLNPRVVEHCLSKGYTIIPGVNNPSQIEQGLELGITTFKYFPAVASGGIKMLEAITGPYGRLKFMATGGISQDNLGEYLDSPLITACGGSWMAPSQMIQDQQFSEIHRLCIETKTFLDSRRRS